jgi:hypothetical protein
MKTGWWRALLFARLLSPQGLAIRAAAVVLIFLVLHACGLREYTTLLTGTSPTGGRIDGLSVMLALFYLAAHLGAVVVAPMLVLAGGLWAWFLYWRGGAGVAAAPSAGALSASGNGAAGGPGSGGGS